MGTHAPTTIHSPIISDGTLVQRARAGDQEAFELLVRRYYRMLFDLIYRYVNGYHDACDVLQQVLLQLYLSLTILHTETSLKGWLFQVARTRSIDHLRRKHPVYFSELERAVKEDEEPFQLSIVDTSASPEEVAEQHEVERRLLDVIQSLPSRYRQVVAFRCTTPLSFYEIGQVLHIPEATAKTYFYRSRSLLRSALKLAEDTYHTRF